MEGADSVFFNAEVIRKLKSKYRVTKRMSKKFNLKRLRITKKVVLIVALLIVTGVVGWFAPMAFRWYEESKQNQFEAKHDEAQNLRLKGRSDEAIKSIENSLNDPSLTDDQRYRLYIDRGLVPYEKADYQEAISYFEKAEQIKQDNEIVDLLSRTWEKANNKEKAIEYYKKFIESLPEGPLRDEYKEQAENAIKQLGGTYEQAN